ncbi:MAG TPA: hypothetical protein VM492_05745 [Sumerlaeia bacterium]|nr:hypothetical protein [Sumerlaeia bacterium]
MRTGHVTRKELKTDEVAEAGRSLFEFLHDHRTRILMVAGVILAALVLFRLASGFAVGRRLDAATEVSRVREILLEATRGEEPGDRERISNSVIARCDDIIASYGSTDAALEALYIKGSAYQLLRELDEAESVFKAYLEKAQRSEDRAKGQTALGYVYEDRYFRDRGNQDWSRQAKEAYQKARELGTDLDGRLSYQACYAMMSLARLHTAMEEFDQAAEIYREIVEKRPFYGKDYQAPPDVETLDLAGKSRDEQVKIVHGNLREALAQLSFEREAKARLEEIEPRLGKTVEATTQ